MRIGNKLNSFLNGQWAKHGRPFGKKIASSRRRSIDKDIIKKEHNES